MTKIKLLLLEGCSKCQKLKEALGKNYIHYDYEVCKSDTVICDSIEDAIGCSNYPIVLKMISKSLIEEIAYITDNYEDIGKTLSINNKVKLKPVYSIDKLIEYVINS